MPTCTRIALVTRPEPQASAMAALLRAHGHTALTCPLLDIVAGNELSALPAHLVAADWVIAVSVAAVEFASQHLQQNGLHWPRCRYAAIGRATQAAFARQGITALTPDDPRSEGLLAQAELQAIDARRVLILRGNDGRDLLAETLTLRGALVHYCAVYARHYPPLAGEHLTAQWQAAGVDSLLVTSGELLDRLIALVAPSARPWLYRRHLVLPSPRLADAAKAAGFTNISVARSAANSAMLAALEQGYLHDQAT
ncbi:MAG: uroporphyrinogen-III synthase [Aeromonas sp.]